MTEPQTVYALSRLIRVRIGSASFGAAVSSSPSSRDTAVPPPVPNTPPTAIIAAKTGRPKVIADSSGTECNEPMKPALMML